MNKKLLKVALLSASMLVATAPAINANIPAMAAAFPDIPLSMVEMLTTIPSLFLMISVLTSSFIAKKLGYKQTIVLGLSITSISGVIPAFIGDFYVVLVSRALLGFGIGLFNSLLITLIAYFFDGEERTSMLGFHEALGGLGGMVITFIAGRLINIHWQAPFLAYSIAFITLGIVIKVAPKVKTSDILEKVSRPVTGKEENTQSGYFVIGFMILIVISAILYMTMGIKVATLIVQLGYGQASDGSLVIMLLSFGAMLSGFLFGKMYRWLKDYILPLGYIVVACAMFMIGVSNHTYITVLGGFLVGFGFRVVMPYLTNIVNMAHLKNTTLATSLLLVAYNLGCAFAPYGSLLIQELSWIENLRGTFYIDGIGFIILAVFTTMVITIKNRRRKVETV